MEKNVSLFLSNNSISVQNHHIDRAEQIFASIKNKSVFVHGAMWKGENEHKKPNEIKRHCYSGYLSNGLPEKVLQLYKELSIKADVVLLTLVCNACARLVTPEAIQLGNSILRNDLNEKTFSQNQNFFNSILDMLMKFGQIDQAEEIFSQRLNRRDPTSFAVMINGFNINGQTKKCLKFFDLARQLNIRITDAIAVPLVAACSQIGLISTCQLISKHIELNSKTDQRLTNVLIDMWVRKSVDRTI